MRADRRLTRPLALAALSVITACGSAGGATEGSPRSITVAAASDLRPAFEELGAAFTDRTGTAVTFSFGSSGQLSEQIQNGAPFDMFASANEEYVDEVIAAGRGWAETKARYGLGRLVLWAPPGIELPTRIDDLAALRFRRIVIANPDHAPYGLAAKEALQSVGIYDDVSARLVYGENIADAYRIVRSGNADVGIIALSLAIADGSAYTSVPDDLHQPIHQMLVVTSTGASGAAAEAFAADVASPAGREVMIRYGFALPGETPPGDGS